jgi:hypothetical protein
MNTHLLKSKIKRKFLFNRIPHFQSMCSKKNQIQGRNAGSEVRSHSFELKNWFKRCASHEFCIEIYTFNRTRGSKFAFSMIITNLNAKLMIYVSFESIFDFAVVSSRLITVTLEHLHFIVKLIVKSHLNFKDAETRQN